MCARLPQSWPTLCDPMDCSPPGSSAHGDSPGKNTGVGCRAPLQGIFPSQGSNPHLLCLLCWWVGSLPLAPHGKPCLRASSSNWSYSPHTRISCSLPGAGLSKDFLYICSINPHVKYQIQNIFVFYEKTEAQRPQ